MVVHSREEQNDVEDQVRFLSECVMAMRIEVERAKCTKAVSEVGT